MSTFNLIPIYFKAGRECRSPWAPTAEAASSVTARQVHARLQSWSPSEGEAQRAEETWAEGAGALIYSLGLMS